MRILASKESIISPSVDSIRQLKEKHPPKFAQAPNPPDIEEEESCFKTNTENMTKAIFSFKKGAAGGPDGFLPQHLKDMCGKALGEPATKLVNTLVTFMNEIIFPGKVPIQVRMVFC